MLKKFNLILLLLSLFSHLSAESDLVEKFKIRIGAGEIHNVELPENMSSLAFKSNTNLALFKIWIDDKEYEISSNNHIDVDENNISNLIFPLESSELLKLYSKESAKIELFILKVPQIGLHNFSRLSRTDSCEKPQGIDQDIWRAGLAAPTAAPSLNQVNHCIIHHSAGSNTATDFTEVVRNIYVYHTDVNGWDDIGYNYLIAPDGTLFHGRDGQGMVSDDNVRGAHFCAKNTGTMGICLLGDFTTAVPQLAALSTLEDLLLWKLNKESLSPTDSARHPVPGGAFLGRVAGHQDGCATACPGTFLYADIPSIIDSLDSRIGNCPLPSALEDIITDNVLKVFPQPAKEHVTLSSEQSGIVCIYDYLGKEVFRQEKSASDLIINVKAYPSGTYYIKLFSRDRQLRGKMLICP